MEQLIKHLQNIKVATQLMRVTGDISETGKSNLDYAIDEAIKLSKNNSIKANSTCHTDEVGNLIADALLGEMSRKTAKEGSSFDKQRKKIVKEITENIYGEHNWHLNVECMLRIFKAGTKYGS